MAKATFCGTWICTQFLFLNHNCGSRYASKPIKPSKDSDDSLVSKKTQPQITCWFGAQGQVNSAKKSQKNAPIITSLTENTKPKTKKDIFIQTRRLAESVKGLNISLAQSAGELWSCKKLQSRAKKVAHGGLKGGLRGT